MIDALTTADVPLVVSWGGGVNSTAMLIGMRERGIVPRLILFADTGGEKPETYAYRERFSAWLESRDMPAIVTVHYNSLKDVSLEDESLRLGMLPSLAYGFKKCSLKWKRQPQDRFVRGWSMAQKIWAEGGRIVKAIGYDFGEQRRLAKAPLDDDRYRYWYPLAEWHWRRADCIEVIKRADLCVPPKSACFFCPATKAREVVELKRRDPGLFWRAVAMERAAAPNNTTIKGLGRHWSWEDAAKIGEAQLELLNGHASTPCECWDGDRDDMA